MGGAIRRLLSRPLGAAVAAQSREPSGGCPGL